MKPLASGCDLGLAPALEMGPELLRRWNFFEPSPFRTPIECRATQLEGIMNRIIYIVGLIVIVIAILSFFGLR